MTQSYAFTVGRVPDSWKKNEKAQRYAQSRYGVAANDDGLVHIGEDGFTTPRSHFLPGDDEIQKQVEWLDGPLKILDHGAAVGLFGARLAALPNVQHVTSYDPNPRYIPQLHRVLGGGLTISYNTPDIHVHYPLSLVEKVTAISHLSEIPDASLDVVTQIGVWTLFKSPEACVAELKEINRMLRVGGLLMAAVEYSLPSQHHTEQGFQMTYWKKDEYRQQLAEAGFECSFMTPVTKAKKVAQNGSPRPWMAIEAVKVRGF